MIPKHHLRLAWHETLELHELVAFQANVLTQLKKNIKKVKDCKLKEIYKYSIHLLEKNLVELLAFYPDGLVCSSKCKDETPFYAGNLLIIAKTSVRNYATAITETATPELRKVLTKQLKKSIRWHQKIFDYMCKRGLYPAYDLKHLLMNDMNSAMKAINLSY